MSATPDHYTAAAFTPRADARPRRRRSRLTRWDIALAVHVVMTSVNWVVLIGLWVGQA